ncbi:MAG TPA: tetratricopeptide repeat protein [Burkholderiaceae bacterium]|jgi:tetratricopeptide (TPR) repeat protein
MPSETNSAFPRDTIERLLTLFNSNSLRAAEQLARELMEQHPEQLVAWKVLGASLKLLGEPDLDVWLQASKRFPGDAEIFSNLGNALRAIGSLDNAIHCYRRAVILDPEFAIGLCNLGIALLERGELFDAIDCLKRSLRLRPALVNARNNLGIALGDLGRFDEAVGQFRLTLDTEPDFSMARSNLLFTLNHISGLTDTALLQEAVRYGEMASRLARPSISWENIPQQDRCLRIGLISGDLRDHAVGHFLLGVLTALAADHGNSLTFFAYYNHQKNDTITERIRRCCQSWRVIVDLPDETVANIIARDHIDILIDLSGHTAHNRLPVLAWKPAPIQATWLGYYATTGIAAIDYLFADPYTVSEAQEAFFVEKVWRMPEVFSCFSAPDFALGVSPLPALANGKITFGSFNNMTKMNEEVIALWSRVLHAVPGSLLFLKCKQLNLAAIRSEVLERFADHGVDAARLILEGSAPRAQLLAAYARVDIALDPFPYTGCTTTAEALWMGVPVVTLAGQRYLGLQSASLLKNAGLAAWIAHSAEDYVALAARYAGDEPHLQALRAGLRAQALASPVFDNFRFAAHFEAALREMWRKWCALRNGDASDIRDSSDG